MELFFCMPSLCRPVYLKLYRGRGTYSLLQNGLCDVGPSCFQMNFELGDSKVWKSAHHLLCDVTSQNFLIIPKETGLLCVINQNKHN